MANKPWETLGSPAPSEGASSGEDDLFVGSGLGSDMKGDYKPSASANLRFWLKKSSSKDIIFLTEGNQAPIIWEHNFKWNGKWFNYLTCLKTAQSNECPFCEFAMANNGLYQRRKAIVFTVIDTNEWVDASGNKRKNEKRLLVASGTSVPELLTRRYTNLAKQGKGLKFAKFTVHRGGSPKSSSVGDDYEYIEHVNPSAIADPSELDYKSIFKRRPAEMEAIVNALISGVSSTPTSSISEGTDDEVEY